MNAFSYAARVFTLEPEHQVVLYTADKLSLLKRKHRSLLEGHHPVRQSFIAHNILHPLADISSHCTYTLSRHTVSSLFLQSLAMG